MSSADDHSTRPPRYSFFARWRRFVAVYREARALGFTLFGAYRAARKSS